MSRLGSLAYLRVLLTALFLAVQTAGMSHAALYGDAPHEHDGVSCDEAVIASEDQALLPDAVFAPVPVPHVLAYTTPTLQITHYQWPPERGPPPRSPPAHIQ